jgi:hypothetical protein
MPASQSGPLRISPQSHLSVVLLKSTAKEQQYPKIYSGKLEHLQKQKKKKHCIISRNDIPLCFSNKQIQQIKLLIQSAQLYFLTKIQQLVTSFNPF